MGYSVPCKTAVAKKMRLIVSKCKSTFKYVEDFNSDLHLNIKLQLNVEHIYPNGFLHTDTLGCIRKELEIRGIPDAFDLCNAVVGDP